MTSCQLCYTWIFYGCSRFGCSCATASVSVVHAQDSACWWHIGDTSKSSVQLQEIMDVAELAASALSMLTTRSDGRERLRRCDAIASMAHAFKACMEDCVLEHLGSALGNLANHSTARQQMRDAGMVGILTRVLRLCHRPRAQACSPCRHAYSTAIRPSSSCQTQEGDLLWTPHAQHGNVLNT